MYHKKCSNLKGLTLIELMFALSISLLILGPLSLLYVAAQKNYLAQTALSSIQENGQIAMQILNTALMAKGHIGCPKWAPNLPFDNHSPLTIGPLNTIQDYHGHEIKPGTQAFTIKSASNTSTLLMETMKTNTVLHVSNEIHFKNGDTVLISNCQRADAFIVKNTTMAGKMQIITSQSPLHYLYNPPAEISQLETNTYFIAKTSRTTSHGENIYALYVKDRSQQKEELVDGINDMQIQYDVLHQNHLERGPVLGEMNDATVLGVAIKLTFVSLNAFPIQKNEYTYVALRE